MLAGAQSERRPRKARSWAMVSSSDSAFGHDLGGPGPMLRAGTGSRKSLPKAEPLPPPPGLLASAPHSALPRGAARGRRAHPPPQRAR